jgi:hypothetical protein
MSNNIIFGTGGYASLLSENIKVGTKIVAYLDTFENSPKSINGIPVIKLEQLNDYIFDYIVIGFSKIMTAIQVLHKAGITDDKIVGYSFIESKPYNDNFFQIQTNEIIKHLTLNEKIVELFDIPTKKYFLCAMNKPEDYKLIESDYVREMTLKFLSEEIYRKRVSGSVAELGVYKGDFAKKINYLFNDRDLYLFDTFEGFNQDSIDSDNTLLWEKLDIFKNTSVRDVLGKMNNPNKCIIKKGFFPDTFDLDDSIRFSFVSIDVDLFDPIKNGLEVFYPRLNKGGYIMVHDYNNIVFRGAMEAVRYYCDKRDISYVPIPDIAGSIIITK